MDIIETLKLDLREGRISAERLVDLVVDLCGKLETANQRIEELNRRIEDLEKQGDGTPTAKVDEPFSTRAEEKRQEARGKKRRKRKPDGRRGRGSTDDKVAQAERTTAVFPEGVPPDACGLSHVRPAWRLENGRAVLVAYQIYRGPGDRYGQIPGVLGRSEYGLEIVTEIAYLVYIVGLSFDKACHLLHFFQDLRLRKSQANTLLYQLSRDWEREFDSLCTLLARSLVVHADETRWSLNSVWAFLSEKHPREHADVFQRNCLGRLGFDSPTKEAPVVLPAILNPFLEGAPAAVMTRIALDWIIDGTPLDELFDEVAADQYTRELTLTHFVQVMLDVASGHRPSPRAAFLRRNLPLVASLSAFDRKLNRMGLAVPEAVVRRTALRARQLIVASGGLMPEPIEG